MYRLLNQLLLAIYHHLKLQAQEDIYHKRLLLRDQWVDLVSHCLLLLNPLFILHKHILLFKVNLQLELKLLHNSKFFILFNNRFFQYRFQFKHRLFQFKFLFKHNPFKYRLKQFHYRDSSFLLKFHSYVTLFKVNNKLFLFSYLYLQEFLYHMRIQAITKIILSNHNMAIHYIIQLEV